VALNNPEEDAGRAGWVAFSLFPVAQEGDASAMIFWGKRAHRQALANE